MRHENHSVVQHSVPVNNVLRGRQSNTVFHAPPSSVRNIRRRLHYQLGFPAFFGCEAWKRGYASVCSHVLKTTNRFQPFACQVTRLALILAPSCSTCRLTATLDPSLIYTKACLEVLLSRLLLTFLVVVSY